MKKPDSGHLNDHSKMVKGEGLVLVVDDEPIMRKIARNVLEGCGYRVIVLEGGKEALTIYKDRYSEIDLVLLDLLMPDKNGKETYLEMKKINPRIKVILVTGAKKDPRIQELMNQGVKSVVEKPYTFQLLSEKVSEALKLNTK